MDELIRRTWVEIDLDAARHNLELIRGKVQSAEIMCIVKADAYGHGVQHIALEYQSMGVNWFGVSNVEEAAELRNYGIDREILVLGYTPLEAARMLNAYNITQAVYDEEYAQQLSKAAKSGGYTIKCHLKADTGMGRIGFNCRSGHAVDEQTEQCARVCRLEGLDFTGIFTHFSVADEGESGREFTEAQFSNFMQLIERLGEKGITFRWRHCCNSGGLLEYPEMQLDMCRPGIILYGLSPSRLLDGKYKLHPVMQLKTAISMVKKLEKGASVSYGRTFTAEDTMTVATVPIGYADGYPRALSGRQELLVHGKRAKILGKVCMDQLMLDVSEIPDVAVGDVVTAFGRDGDEEISVDELAAKIGTINYELVCRMARRVPRVYIKNGSKIKQTDYLL